jgi:hypothetical protein
MTRRRSSARRVGNAELTARGGFVALCVLRRHARALFFRPARWCCSAPSPGSAAASARPQEEHLAFSGVLANGSSTTSGTPCLRSGSTRKCWAGDGARGGLPARARHGAVEPHRPHDGPHGQGLSGVPFLASRPTRSPRFVDLEQGSRSASTRWPSHRAGRNLRPDECKGTLPPRRPSRLPCAAPCSTS